MDHSKNIDMYELRVINSNTVKKMIHVVIDILNIQSLVKLYFQFEYTVTCAVCTRTSAKDLQILKKCSQVSDDS